MTRNGTTYQMDVSNIGQHQPKGELVRGPIGNYRIVHDLGDAGLIKQCATCGESWGADLDYCPYCNISRAARVLHAQREREQDRVAHVAYNSGNNEWYTPPEYIEAARAIGVRPVRIIFVALLPNVMATLLVQVTVSIAGAILLESALSFLGLGTPLPAPSWGSMLSIGRGYMAFAPWYSIFPGLAITLLVMGLFLLGDGLRDALDPRRQKLL